MGTWLSSVLKCYAQGRLKCVYISDVVKINVKMGMAKYKKVTGVHPYKEEGVLVGIVKKEPLRGIKVLFCGRGLNCVSALGGDKSKTAHYLLSYIFRLSTLKGTVNAPPVGLCGG